MDRRHDRRSLSKEEQEKLLRAAIVSDVVFRGQLTGRDRYFLYLAALSSGFRAAELAVLTRESFGTGTITISARHTKNRQTVTQPIPVAVSAALAEFIRDKEGRVWPGSWWNRAADMMKVDLNVAGIKYRMVGVDGPLFADFHSLRHSYISGLQESGASVKEAQALARHSDPRLTLIRYTHKTQAELAVVVEGATCAGLAGANKLAERAGLSWPPRRRSNRILGLRHNSAFGCHLRFSS